MEHDGQDSEHDQMNKLYDECISYLEKVNVKREDRTSSAEDPDYETITERTELVEEEKPIYKIENEKSRGSIDSVLSEARSERLRKLSQQLPKIIITQSNTSLEMNEEVSRNYNFNKPEEYRLVPVSPINRSVPKYDWNYGNNNNLTKSVRDVSKTNKASHITADKRRGNIQRNHTQRRMKGYASEYPKRLVTKTGFENVALISNVPFEKIRLLNDTFHTLINLRWRWIVIGTIVVHFAIWLVFAVFWYITALAHYDFEPDPPEKTCITGGKDFVTIFLASVEAQTTIGFGDRAIDEECPESIFLFIMQLILGTGLSGVLTCVVYAKLTRPEKLSRDGVGFSKKALISMRDGRLCLMMRAWDLNYDHIISSEFTAHFINTYRTKEGEVIRYYARGLALQQRQFLLWPVTLVHVIDATSPLYEITLSLKGASASMGTFTQSQTSYLPREVVWGYRFPSVVKYNCRKQKYEIDHKKLDHIEPVDTPYCCARELDKGSTPVRPEPPRTPGTPSSFSEAVASFQLERSSSFRIKSQKS